MRSRGGAAYGVPMSMPTATRTSSIMEPVSFVRFLASVTKSFVDRRLTMSKSAR